MRLVGLGRLAVLLGLLLGSQAAVASPSPLPLPSEAAPPARTFRDRFRQTTVVPTLRVALGPSFAAAVPTSAGLAVDVSVGAALSFTDKLDDRLFGHSLWLRPELGYSLRTGSDSPLLAGHLASIGLGVGYGNVLFASGAYTPRLVVGANGQSPRELAIGLRHGLSGSFLAALLFVEVSHQLLVQSGRITHELLVVAGLNLGAPLVLLLL